MHGDRHTCTACASMCLRFQPRSCARPSPTALVSTWINGLGVLERQRQIRVPSLHDINPDHVKNIRNSILGTATRYELDGPGIDSWWGMGTFSAPVMPKHRAHPASCTVGTGSLPGVRRPGRGVNHLAHLGLRLKKK